MLTQCYCVIPHSLDDAPKKLVMSQAQKKKLNKIMKDEERYQDTASIRGYSTDQRISIESMSVNIRRLEHQKKETCLVGLSIQESAIGRQIVSTENRAMQRCPTYDKNNPYWIRVDKLISQQSDVVLMINQYNTETLLDENERSSVTHVSDFLNQASPVKTQTKFKVIESTKDKDTAVDEDKSNDDVENTVLVFDVESESVDIEKGPYKIGASINDDDELDKNDASIEVKEEIMDKARKKKKANPQSKATRVSSRKRNKSY